MEGFMLDKLLSFKNWMFGLKIGSVAVIIWYVIKILVCMFAGICIL